MNTPGQEAHTDHPSEARAALGSSHGLLQAILLGALLVSLTALLWLSWQRSLEDHRRALQNAASSVRESLELRIDGHRDYLLMLSAARAAGELRLERFRELAEHYLSDHPELLSIVWTDDSLVVQDVASLSGDQRIDVFSSRLAEPSSAARRARATRQPAYTAVFESIQGHPSFELWVPVLAEGGAVQGFLAGTYACTDLLRNGLPPTILEGHLVELLVDGAAIAVVDQGGVPNTDLEASVALEPPGHGLRARLVRYGGQLWRLNLTWLAIGCIVFAGALLRVSSARRQEVSRHLRTLEKRRLAEGRLRDSEARLAAILDNAPTAIYLKDLEGRYLLVNPLFERHAGVDQEDILGCTDSDFFFPDVAKRFRENDQRVLAQGPIKVEETLLLDAEEKVFSSIKFPILGADGEPVAVCGISTDISAEKESAAEREKLAEQLAGVQKLEAVGRLAGGVARDFNDVLAAVLRRVDTLQEILGDTARGGASRQLEEIRYTAERAAAVTGKLLAFSRQRIGASEVLAPGRVLDEMRPMLESMTRTGIELEVDTAASRCILFEGSQLELLVLHLVLNACDAMPEGGRLEVACKDVELTQEEVLAQLGEWGGSDQTWIELRVTDQGIGMDRATQERIFEPFFTTKSPTGSRVQSQDGDLSGSGLGGSGLGLAAVYGMVQKAGGFVTVESSPGRGSVFRVLLPAVDDAEALPEEPIAAEGQGVILVCEDEELVRTATCHALQTAGYTVLPAADAREALEIAADQPGGIDLLLSDVVLPGMNGVELAEALAEAQPGLCRLFVSGYTAEVLATQGLDDSQGQLFLQKPYRLATLLHRVGEILA